MKRRFFYCLGKCMGYIGRRLACPFLWMERKGLELWDTNCDCWQCVERRFNRGA